MIVAEFLPVVKQAHPEMPVSVLVGGKEYDVKSVDTSIVGELILTVEEGSRSDCSAPFPKGLDHVEVRITEYL